MEKNISQVTSKRRSSQSQAPFLAMSGLSIVVPTLNEAGNIRHLLERIDHTMQLCQVPYEVIFIDDHSQDETRKVIRYYADRYPLRMYLKEGKAGKAESLLEGFRYARYNLCAFIDADLQYPPEALAPMINKIKAGYDVVVAHRTVHRENWIRRFMSGTHSFLFIRLLHQLNYDVQAGLKMFRKQVLMEMKLAPTPWTFDLAFLINARNHGHTIGTVDITFEQRQAGKSKVSVLGSTFEIAKNSLLLRFKRHRPALIRNDEEPLMIGSGLAYKQQRFITHTTLPPHVSALQTFLPWQRNFLVTAGVVLLAGLILWPLNTAIVLMAILSLIYFFDVFFNIYLVRQSLITPQEITFQESEIAALKNKDLPVYSILCPLYKEGHILPSFMSALHKLDWPKDKLDVLLLLEADDTETIAAAAQLNLPAYIRTIIVPPSLPQTKPKACNYGLSLARGDYLVIYDAEDIPDANQLKKAYIAFQILPENVKCLQAKLNYFNPHQNLLTRLFTAEYSLWFDVMLTGMQSLNTTIPLGGTSNHFRTADLQYLEGWDPFNVTEDCDLGTRLFRLGYKTAVIDSVTLEEANSNGYNWLRQRSRWLKGYMQTYLVHMRTPWKLLKEHGVHALFFQFIVGGKVAFMIINPLMWVATISYFAFFPLVGSTIEALFPAPVFAMAAISLVFGNFLHLYYYMIGCARRGHWSLMKYIFLIPFYWLLTSVAAYIALYQLIRKPHYWEKTNHGLHQVESTKKVDSIPKTSPAWAEAQTEII